MTRITGLLLPLVLFLPETSPAATLQLLITGEIAFASPALVGSGLFPLGGSLEVNATLDDAAAAVPLGSGTYPGSIVSVVGTVGSYASSSSGGTTGVLNGVSPGELDSVGFLLANLIGPDVASLPLSAGLLQLDSTDLTTLLDESFPSGAAFEDLDTPNLNSLIGFSDGAAIQPVVLTNLVASRRRAGARRHRAAPLLRAGALRATQTVRHASGLVHVGMRYRPQDLTSQSW